MTNQEKIMVGYRETISDLRRQSSPRMSVSKAIGIASYFMLKSYDKTDLLNAIKSDRQIEMFGTEKTWINALNKHKQHYNNR